MELAVEVRTCIGEARNRIPNCQTSKELFNILSQFVDLLSCSDEENEVEAVSSCFGIRYTPAFKNEFLENHFSYFCEHVLRSVDTKFLDDKSVATILRRLFMEAPADLSFLVLLTAISSVTHTVILHQLISILDFFASHGKFVELLFSQCLTGFKKASSQDLLLLLASLPDKLANKMKLSLSAKFHPNSYYQLLASELLKTLQKVHQVAFKAQAYTTNFLSKLIGKVALRGSVDAFLDVVLPQFKQWSYTSPLWSSLCSQILMQVQESALEPILETMLKKITFYPFFCKLLKDTIHTNSLVKLLLTHKFLFVKHYSEPNVLQNIIGYLCGAGRREILLNTLKEILTHWGNPNCIKHSSYLQHLYATQAVILLSVQLNEIEIAQHKQGLFHKLLPGVQMHLESADKKIRQLGMITAELMTACLHPGGENLRFEYDEDDCDIQALKVLSTSPKFGTDVEKENFLKKPNVVSGVQLETVKSCTKTSATSTSDTITKPKPDSNVNDVDDDLLPFDISEEDNDLIEGIHPPRYISECIDGLLSADDPKRYIASLRVLKKLINSDQDNLYHLCVQLVTVLLHLQDKYSLDDYNELRFSSMVAATISCPVPIADHLTKEFYAPNYSLRQRMDILDVLSVAAAELSRPISQAKKQDVQSLDGLSKVKEAKDWHLIVEERIKKKTRRISSKTPTAKPKAIANRFASVAGHFFFPLLKSFDSRQNTFDLLGEDCLVLGSLVCTVGNIMYCAHATPIAHNMAKALLEFVWVLRYHADSHVRRALLFALAMAVVSVPDFFLMSEVQDELAECQNWLEIVLNNDPSNECRKLAAQVLMSIRDVFKRQFGPNA